MQIQPLPREIQPSLQEFQVGKYPSLKALSQFDKTLLTRLCLLSLTHTLLPLLLQHVLKGQSDQDPVGRPIMHRSAISQTTGEAVYCDDIPRTDGELFLALVTSSRAHAKIT